MKRFAEFITGNDQFRPLTERKSDQDHDSAGLSSTHVPHDINDPQVKARINAILGHCAVSEFLNPSAAVGIINSKLGQLGIALDGDAPEITESGTYTISMKRYGDQFGKTVDTPHDEFDNQTEVVTLSLKVEKLETGSFKVYGSI